MSAVNIELKPSPIVSRVEIVGVDVSTVSMDSAIAAIEQWIADKTPNYVCITGAHGIIESRNDPRLRDIHNAAGMVTPDGMPLVVMARILGFKFVTRVYGPDLMRRLSEISAQRGYRQFYYGGAPGVATRLANTLKAQNPGLAVAGTMTPPFRPLTPEEDEDAVNFINSTAPDIVWVGLSTPKQEYWMASHRGRLNASVIIGTGAAFDFLSGTKRQAPRWMQRSSLEWAYRLASEPRRLWRRYATIVPLFTLLAARQLVMRAVSKGTASKLKVHARG
jgi:N-acetylglucosaminyldiphosphoundecaprenol N-acetyl-beta-D-mannosaminyltransferase